MAELGYKRNNFSSITFNSASLSKRAIARRSITVLEDLGRINRHNLENLSYSHSFHWHSNAVTSQQLSSNIEIAFQEQQFIPGTRNWVSHFIFSYPKIFSRFPPEEQRWSMPFETFLRCNNARTTRRITESRLTLWRKLAGCDWLTGP